MIAGARACRFRFATLLNTNDLSESLASLSEVRLIRRTRALGHRFARDVRPRQPVSDSAWPQRLAELREHVNTYGVPHPVLDTVARLID
jgi:hypothetical protein